MSRQAGDALESKFAAVFQRVDLDAVLLHIDADVFRRDAV